jgi:hypothetical protein
MLINLLLAVQMWYGTFSVLDAGKPGTPTLTPIQQYWLHLIHKAPGYAPHWAHLRFAEQVPTRLPRPTPLIVFDPGDWTPASHVSGLRFHVIGEPCNAYYSPQDKQYLPVSESSCVNRSTPAPVPGEEDVLGGPG